MKDQEAAIKTMEYEISTLLSVCLGVPACVRSSCQDGSFEVMKVNVVLASDESSGL